MSQRWAATGRRPLKYEFHVLTKPDESRVYDWLDLSRSACQPTHRQILWSRQKTTVERENVTVTVR
uniref:Uncharacterized protein n=1 Tax=Peronospora matthiolae TaxID=2874970 RepID=A0AAV1TVY2_9STRA